MQTRNVVVRDLKAYGRPDFSLMNDGPPYPPLVEEVRDRILDRYQRWTDQVAHTRFCHRPIRIRGRVEQVDRGSGEIRTAYSTDGEPDATLLVACGSRSATKCPSCAWWYRGDAFQLVATGLRGGKGVPESVAGHPKVFVTFTAPSFGPVHAHRMKGGKAQPCRPRDRKRLCPHGRPLGCSERHGQRDAVVGTPLCPDCFDAEGQVVWNAMAPKLWARTRTYLPRALARAAGLTQSQLASLVQLRLVKVAEFQKRGAVHYHAVIRIDGVTPADQAEQVVAPPPSIGVELLEAALLAARATAVLDSAELRALGRADSTIRWGEVMDIRRVVAGDGEEMSHETVARYISKYATKLAESMGLPAGPIDGDEIDSLPAPEHLRELAGAAVRLGQQRGLAGLRLGQHSHTLGFGGHFLTKSWSYSTTMGALRQARRRHARRRELADGGEMLDAWGRSEGEGAVAVHNSWTYLGWGYRSDGEGWLVATAKASALESKRIAREEMTTWAA